MSVQSNSSVKTINAAIITVAFLKQHYACKEGIEFFERNFPESLFPEGLDLSKIQVIGDYEGYFRWINDLLECEFEYDSNGNMIKEVTPFGDIYEYEYDSNGNMTKKIYPNGDIYEWQYEYDSIGRLIKRICSDRTIDEYDSNGNMIKKISSNGNIYEYEYDYNGNNIKIVYPFGIIEEYNQYGDIIKVVSADGLIQNWEYEYDSNGNKIKEIFSDGTIKEWQYKYDSIKRPIQLNKCYIEYLE